MSIKESQMRARELARPFPVLPLNADAAEVGRLLAAKGAGVVILEDPTGPCGAVTDGGMLRFLLPSYLQYGPCLARVLEEPAADALRTRLTGRCASELLPTSRTDLEEVDGDATLVDVVEVLARTGAPVVAVREGGRMLGGITTSALLTRLLAAR
jgi:hypothetical protein